MITRRDTLYTLGAAAAAALVAGEAVAQNASAAELAVPGPLGDVWLGPADAKVTIVEYASMTCPHCAAFHQDTFPKLKERYIDPGKVRFTLREFPFDPLATAGFMLARCDGDAKYYPIVDLLFSTQKAWVVDKPLEPLQQIMRQAGFSKEKFESCLSDQKLMDGVNAVRKRAEDTFKVSSTPTFFINGKRYGGSLSFDEMEKILTPLLGA